MSNTVIKVDNLSKSYTISHKSNERYVALRDVIADKFKAVGSMFSFGNRASSVQYPASSSKEQFYALKDVSFEIKQGERVGIIGRNGAKKTKSLSTRGSLPMRSIQFQRSSIPIQRIKFSETK